MVQPIIVFAQDMVIIMCLDDIVDLISNECADSRLLAKQRSSKAILALTNIWAQYATRFGPSMCAITNGAPRLSDLQLTGGKMLCN